MVGQKFVRQHQWTMLDRIPRRLSLAFRGADEAVSRNRAEGAGEVSFVAYAEDCTLSGRLVLEGDRLSDMLNAHDEYVLHGVTVDRFDDGEPLRMDELVVKRDELFMVHATPPRGDATRRLFTTPSCVAVKLGPYRVRGFFHALPGTDPVAALRRRGAMVPLTNARILYDRGFDTLEITVEAVIVNRDMLDWVTAIEPYRTDFPESPEEAAAEFDGDAAPASSNGVHHDPLESTEASIRSTDSVVRPASGRDAVG